jgi:hypothetical protein
MLKNMLEQILFDFYSNLLAKPQLQPYSYDNNLALIKRGGGNGPMKPRQPAVGKQLKTFIT